MPDIAYRLHLGLFYLGMLLILTSVMVEQYWLGTFVGGMVSSLLGMLYYWIRIL
jgi:hypothetical protein